MKIFKNDWFMFSWSLTAMEVTSTVSELGLSQILREKIIVSNTQLCHQIIKIWHAKNHLEKIWDPKIQKWLRYRLFNKKNLNFVVPIFLALYTQMFHQIINIWHQIKHLANIWDQKIQKRMRYRLVQKKRHISYSTKKPDFSSNYQNISWKKMFHENLRWKNAKTIDLCSVDLWLPWR